MRQRSLARSTSCVKLTFSGSVESQYLVGSASPSGHSINSHSGDSFSGISLLYPARTRTRAKREDWSAEPSRHVTVRQACFGRPSATFLAETSSGSSRRPVLFIGLSTRRGPLPGAHIKMVGTIPTAYGTPNSVMLRVSGRMCKQVSVSLPYLGDSHED